jgi:phosphonate transport system substrate-binding protein
MTKAMIRIILMLMTTITAGLFATACGNGDDGKVLYIAGIPDQEVSVLEARFNGLAEYLTDETGITVEYVPTIDYASVVTAFKHGDLHLAWYGGLTGVQARLATPGAKAIAQRPRDEEFHSVFVANPNLGLTSLEDVVGHSLTFGSPSSTSGHLMPRHFLVDAGVDVEIGLDGPPNFSGSHDTTWKLVESGSFEVGALNEAVWEARVKANEVDTDRVNVFFRTPAYYDYHWAIRGDVDTEFGAGASQKITDALLGINTEAGDRERAIAEAFQTDRFIATENENYATIENVARGLGIIEE